MLQSLNHLTLSVSNLQTSLTFWRDLLGLQPMLSEILVLILPVLTFGSVFLTTYPVTT